jgi:RNA polymerase sigma factor (sigma-70 family)
MTNSLQKTIKQCLKNDRKAQFELYQLSFDHLMRTCKRYKRNREDALSLLNDGFLKVLLNLKSYDAKQDFFPWASTIMVRTAIDDFRKHRTYKEDTDFSDSDVELEALNMRQAHIDTVGQLTAKEVQDIIFELPENERVVFNLFEWEGYKHHEIAEKLGVTERTTKRYLRSAKVLLKKMIEKRSDLRKVI